MKFWKNRESELLELEHGIVCTMSEYVVHRNMLKLELYISANLSNALQNPEN